MASEMSLGYLRKRNVAKSILFRLPLVLGILLICISIVLIVAAGTYVDCETLTIGTSVCFLFWFNYPIQLSLVALGALLVFSHRLTRYRTTLAAFGLGALLTYATGLVSYRGYSMILDTGNYPCQLLEYGYPLPWLTQIVTCTMTGSFVDQLIIPAGRFGLDMAIWTMIAGLLFLAFRARQLGRLTTLLIGVTALLGLVIVVLVLGSFS
ncbi:MAG TPA: hypothetical protein VE862_04685 [Candidatus Acidoferrum sp.]|nr:hypothetical protein [Candidatus Acidoferrum sp.]